MSKEFIIFSLSFAGGFLIRSLFSHLFMLGAYISYMQTIERKFLMLVLNYSQWKAHALGVLEITYDHCSQEDKDKEEEFKLIKAKIEEKCTQISEEYVKGLNAILPYKTEYKNFKQAVEFIEKNGK